MTRAGMGWCPAAIWIWTHKVGLGGEQAWCWTSRVHICSMHTWSDQLEISVPVVLSSWRLICLHRVWPHTGLWFVTRFSLVLFSTIWFSVHLKEAGIPVHYNLWCPLVAWSVNTEVPQPGEHVDINSAIIGLKSSFIPSIPFIIYIVGSSDLLVWFVHSVLFDHISYVWCVCLCQGIWFGYVGFPISKREFIKATRPIP